MPLDEAVALFEQVRNADDDAVEDVRNVGREQVEGEIAQDGGRDVTTIVVETHVSVARRLHLLPVGDDHLRGKGFLG